MITFFYASFSGKALLFIMENSEAIWEKTDKFMCIKFSQKFYMKENAEEKIFATHLAE